MKKGFKGGEQLAAVFGVVNILLIEHNFSRCDLISEVGEKFVEVSPIVHGM